MKSKLLKIALYLCIFLNIAMNASDSDTDIEYEEKDVAVSSEMTYRLMQIFTHEAHHYKNIEYSELYKKYMPSMLKITKIALDQSELSEDEQYESYAYTIVGEEQVWSDEPLFDCEKARQVLIDRVNRFIDRNEVIVRQKCVGHALQENKSKMVWAPGCCDLQLHKDCFKQCRNHNMTRCISSFCTVPWTPDFYEKASRRKHKEGETVIHHFVPMTKIRNTDCPLCLEPLRVDEAIAESESINKKSGLIIDSDGTTPGNKKMRFL